MLANSKKTSMIWGKRHDSGHPKYLSAYSIASASDPTRRFHVSCVHDCDGLVAESAFCEISAPGGVAEAYGHDERLSKRWKVRKSFSLGEFPEGGERRCQETGRVLPRTAFDEGFAEDEAPVIFRRLSL